MCIYFVRSPIRLIPHFQGLQGFLNVRNNLSSTSLSPSTSHINGLPHQRPPMLSGSRPPSGIPQGLPPPHFPTHHQRPPPSSNPPVGLLGNSSQMQVFILKDGVIMDYIRYNIQTLTKFSCFITDVCFPVTACHGASCQSASSNSEKAAKSNGWKWRYFITNYAINE